MTEQKNSLSQLFAACWRDEALKDRFMADPKAVLKEYNLDVPDGIHVKVVENADDRVYITLPHRPSVEVSDEELESAAGGGRVLEDENDPDLNPGLGFIRSMAS